MPITIFLRTNATINLFRDAIITVLGSKKIDEALLCSGFFQDRFKGSSYEVSSEQALSTVCASSGVSLTTVGVHNSSWRPAYINFRDNMRAQGAKIKCMYKGGMRWHAKVFIGSSAGRPNIGIVGSSNMTRNAFSTSVPFNNECDVFIWDRRSPMAALAGRIEDTMRDQILVKAPYVSSFNRGQTISELLTRIQSQVLSGDLRDL